METDIIKGYDSIYSNCALMLSIKAGASKFINCMNQQLGLIIKRPKLISTHGKRQVHTYIK